MIGHENNITINKNEKMIYNVATRNRLRLSFGVTDHA